MPPLFEGDYMKPIGLYIHIPFCNGKCPYCDFYSLTKPVDLQGVYVSALIDEIKNGSRLKGLFNKKNVTFDTIYLGGGTPSVLSGEEIYNIITAIKENYNLCENVEITVECNPNSDIYSLIPYFKKCGVNRISMGLQSAVDNERQILGRLSDRNQVENAVKMAQRVGFKNITLDVMLGIPNQTEKSLNETLDFCVSLGVPHISAYMLKLEENTHFYKNQDKYNFPDDDLTADLYLQMCEKLEENGIMQYEISNFSFPSTIASFSNFFVPICS